MVPQSFAHWTPLPLSSVERHLYVQLEDALLNDAATLEQLREVFFQAPSRPNEIQFLLNITADSIPASNCSVCSPSPWDTYKPAFCPINKTTRNSNTSSMAQWEFCSNMKVTWGVIPDLDAIDLIKALTTTVIPWCTHGLSLLMFMTSHPGVLAEGFYNHGSYNIIYNDREPAAITLLVKKLHCHPYVYQLAGAVGQFFSWIEVYTKSGGKSPDWNPQQQATATVFVKQGFSIWGTYWLTDYFYLESSLHLLHIFGMVGCFLLTFSLLFLISRLFLIYHSKLVHKKMGPGSRSLYWGTAVVTLLLVSIIMLGKTFPLYLPMMIHMQETLLYMFYVSNFAIELIIPLVFLLISIIASRNSKVVPMPAAKFTTHVLFCCCCCFCCSSRRKSRGVQVMTLWAFMTFIYYNITEAIALVFTLFYSIPLTISYALIYVSGVFFAIMLVSIILFSCQSSSKSQSNLAKLLGVVDVCATLFSFPFVLFVFVAFIAMFPIFSHIKVKGFEAVSLKFSLVPSIALSVAGWFIRKKLLKKDDNSVQSAPLTDHRGIADALNDSEGVNDIDSSEKEEHILA